MSVTIVSALPPTISAPPSNGTESTMASEGGAIGLDFANILFSQKLMNLSVNVGEPLGHFMAPLPGERRQQVWPSTVAYVARLVMHRYAMLGVLDEQGFPLREMGILQAPAPRKAAAGEAIAPMAGAPCPECGNATLIHKDGCDFCTACGYVGVCG